MKNNLLTSTVLKTLYSRHLTQDTFLKTHYSRHFTHPGTLRCSADHIDVILENAKIFKPFDDMRIKLLLSTGPIGTGLLEVLTHRHRSRGKQAVVFKADVPRERHLVLMRRSGRVADNKTGVSHIDVIQKLC